MGVYLKKMNAKSSIKRSFLFVFVLNLKERLFFSINSISSTAAADDPQMYISSALGSLFLFFFSNSTPAALWIRRMLLYNMTEFADVIRSRPIISVRVESYLFRRRQLFLKEKLCNLIVEWREFNAKRQENFGEIERFYKRNVLNVSRN